MAQTPDQITGKLQQIKGDTKKRWEQVTENEIQKIKENRAILVNKKYIPRHRKTSETKDEEKKDTE